MSMNKHKQFKIGLLGASTVGAGVFKTLTKDKKSLSRKSASNYDVSVVCVRDITKNRNIDFGSTKVTDNPLEIVNSSDIDIVIELIGGIEPAKTLILTALKNKKYVVTANKALIASCGIELFEEAQKNNVSILFEASVAGAIPIIKLMSESFLANNINRIEGIINGTTNYVLSGMEQRGLSLASAVLEAQDRGFAEADPTADISGLDAVNKICILAYLAYGAFIDMNRIYCEGIEEIKVQDIMLAKELGYKIKHLAIASRDGQNINLRVHPALLPEEHPLAKIDNEMNAILTYGDLFEKILCSGPGAGAFPTTSAVIADVLGVLLSQTRGSNLKNLPLLDPSIKVEFCIPISQYYLRITAHDQAGTLALITKTLASEGISIEAIIQKAEESEAKHVPIAIVTSRSSREGIDRVCEKLSNKDGILGTVTKYRVENYEKGKP